MEILDRKLFSQVPERNASKLLDFIDYNKVKKAKKTNNLRIFVLIRNTIKTLVEVVKRRSEIEKLSFIEEIWDYQEEKIKKVSRYIADFYKTNKMENDSKSRYDLQII
ncbi:hypothetical protein WA026_018265 [Henosepilachna vigintioctopunctata]|uniref:Uncharacterized protein n=1 Tax=Henosepilachna vigintioctopunctata TaxID=420089 RepID=A0AAW1VI75_9CUCU